jgi:hypothetical protein
MATICGLAPVTISWPSWGPMHPLVGRIIECINYFFSPLFLLSIIVLTTSSAKDSDETEIEDA